MFLVPRLGIPRPTLLPLLNQTRTLRPVIKINKSRFQITLDVRNFNKDELRVKARTEYVVVEGKQERKTNNGFVIRQFVRKFKLPQGCDPENMKTTLSPEGVLTIEAKREYCERNLPCETVVPIKYSGPKDPDDSQSFVKVEGPMSLDVPCAAYKVGKKDVKDIKK